MVEPFNLLFYILAHGPPHRFLTEILRTNDLEHTASLDEKVGKRNAPLKAPDISAPNMERDTEMRGQPTDTIHCISYKRMERQKINSSKRN